MLPKFCQVCETLPTLGKQWSNSGYTYSNSGLIQCFPNLADFGLSSATLGQN